MQTSYDTLAARYLDWAERRNVPFTPGAIARNCTLRHFALELICADDQGLGRDLAALEPYELKRVLNAAQFAHAIGGQS